METGSIVEWKVKEGDEVNQGDALASVETDKAVVDYETNDEGYVARILKPTGSKDVPLGTVSGILEYRSMLFYFFLFVVNRYFSRKQRRYFSF